ncbi:MAG TPA: Ca2+-dependent phosphoinositide-specific phospholipase C [Thermoanaerobaculia bacterium]|jgi:hypothetical protein
MATESEIRYNQVRQKSSHNSYERTEGIDDQAIYWRIRSVEFDIHNGKDCTGRPKLNGNWYVYHYCGPGGTSTTVDKLSSALDVCAAFHTAVPHHEVMTLWIDLKDKFDSSHTPDQLDSLIASRLGEGNILRPAGIAGTSGLSLQQAIRQSGWPNLESLRCKFIIALTGGDVKSDGSPLNVYVDKGAKANTRLAFVAPNITAASDIGLKDYVIFFNLDDSHVGLGRTVFQQGFVSRVYELNSKDAWDGGVANQVNHLATNKVNSRTDPWARTDNSHGWPFQGIDVQPDPNLREPGLIYGIQVTSGDIWGSSDSFYFVYNQLSGSAADRTYSVYISTPASHVDEWAKGAVMARASLDANAPYFGVFRPSHKDLRVQYRTSKGGSTSAKEVDIVPPDTVDENNLIYVRLEISEGGRRGRAWGSLDAKSWKLIDDRTFNVPLPYQGWAASSHGDDKVKFLFGNVDGSPAGFGSQQPIGSGVRYGAFFEGIYLP